MESAVKDTQEMSNGNYLKYLYSYKRVSTPISKIRNPPENIDIQYEKFCEYLHKPPERFILKGSLVPNSGFVVGHIVSNRQKMDIKPKECEIKTRPERSIKIFNKSDINDVIISPVGSIHKKDTISVREKIDEHIQAEIIKKKPKYSRNWKKLIDNSKNKWLRNINIFRKGRKASEEFEKPQNKGKFVKVNDDVCF